MLNSSLFSQSEHCLFRFYSLPHPIAASSEKPSLVLSSSETEFGAPSLSSLSENCVFTFMSLELSQSLYLSPFLDSQLFEQGDQSAGNHGRTYYP